MVCSFYIREYTILSILSRSAKVPKSNETEEQKGGVRMEHVTACYWQKEAVPGLFLRMQQRKYRGRETSVVLACISDNGAQARELQDKMEEDLHGAEIRKCREELLQEKWTEYLAEQPENSNCAGILCVENRFLLFSRGRMRICGFFHRFGRTDWRVWKEQCIVGEVEPGTAILLTDNAFLNLCEEELAACLRPGSIGRDALTDRAKRAQKRLEELGRKAEQQGGEHMGAVWILPVVE